MKFNYKDFSIPKSNNPFPERKSLLRPVITIHLLKKDIPYEYEVLLDSGADYCIFHSYMAQKLGINLKKGKAVQFYGTGGRSQLAYFHKVKFKIGDYEVEEWIAFSDSISEMAFGILGQYGFFDSFKICFDLRNQEIELLKP